MIARETKHTPGDLSQRATVTGRDGVTHLFKSGHDAIDFACSRIAEQIVALRVECPVCFSAPDVHCVGGERGERTAPHAQRIAKAEGR